jgi:predicted small secreted protein
MKRIFQPIMIAVIVAVMVSLSGCNTFKGMGKDIEGAGHGIQKAADKTKEAITK